MYISGTSAIIAYAEDQWYRYDDAGREHCWATWIKNAGPMRCTEVVLRLNPDILFPRGEHTEPYILERRPVPLPPEKLFQVGLAVSVAIDPAAYDKASELEQLDLRTKAREAARKVCGAALHPLYVLRVGTREVEKGRL